jgi:hypothetical protein
MAYSPMRNRTLGNLIFSRKEATMKTAITISHWTIRITGLIEIVLGLAFWTNNGLSLVPVHMLVGLILVIALWVLAGLAARAGVNWGFVALAIVCGLIVPILGITQTQLLPGAAHWVVEVIHLLVGLFAIGLGNRLATLSEQRLEPIQLT